MPRPTTLPDPWRSLAAKLGGVQALADALGAGLRTVNDWAAGRRSPRGPSLALIQRVFRDHRLKPPSF